MIDFNPERTTAVLYTCGTCNLNCRYCTIDKNPILTDIDKELEESFKDDYYFDRIKAYFPRRDQLKRVETWGGEPFLHMERIYPLVDKLINYYPYFDTMFSSTNFAYDIWIDQFMGLMQCFAKYPYRHFTYDLQLSVDGPTYINDANRGQGVTKKCIENFDKLIDIIKDNKFPPNITLTMSIKGTWDLDCIHQLNSKEKLIEFYQFYEQNFLDKVFSLENPNIIMNACVPNTAIPAPVTKADGEIFASLVYKCRQIEQENFVKHYFKYYNNITPYKILNQCMACDRFDIDKACCGSGTSVIGFLPHNMISACHEGFTLLVDKYKEYAAKRSDTDLSVTLNKFFELATIPLCLTDDEYRLHEQKMKYISENSTAQFSNATVLIMALAAAGLIEKRYINERMALTAAKAVLINSSFCIKANYAVTGTFCLDPLGLYVLILNGALQYLWEDSDDGDFN